VLWNGLLAQMQFENMKAHPKLLIDQNFSLRIETTVEQLRSVLDRVHSMLDKHPLIEPGSSRIRVNDFAGAAFDLELFAYVKTGDSGPARDGEEVKSGRRGVRSMIAKHSPEQVLETDYEWRLRGKNRCDGSAERGGHFLWSGSIGTYREIPVLFACFLEQCSEISLQLRLHGGGDRIRTLGTLFVACLGIARRHPGVTSQTDTGVVHNQVAWATQCCW
jgi:hypothetical protein